MMTNDRDLSAWVDQLTPALVAHRVEREEVAALAAEHPQHEIWAEQPAGLVGSVKYVAKRRPGTLARPYVVITNDFAEMQAALHQARMAGCTVRRLYFSQVPVLACVAVIDTHLKVVGFRCSHLVMGAPGGIGWEKLRHGQ
jgi:hypothetical protein